MDKCCLLDEDRVTKLVFWSSSREEIKWTMQGTNAAGQGGAKELSLQNQKRFMLQKSPANRKIRKSQLICWQQKTQSEKDYKSGLTWKVEKIKDEKAKDKDEKLLTRKCKFSTEVWKYCLGFAERDFKHTNLVCRAMKQKILFWTLSFKAKASDIQQAFWKNLSMKVNRVEIARDSTGKSQGCVFVTLHWKEFHEHNLGYNCNKEPAMQDKLWTEHLLNIMSQQSVCDWQIYMEDAQSQRWN